MKISVVIPALNEEAYIRETLICALNAGADQIIVCDGGSSDQTKTIATDLKCQVVHATAGRGPQLARGAELALGDVLLFLHADTRLTENCLNQIRNVVRTEPEDDCGHKIVWGCFEHRVQATGWKYRCVEQGNQLRVRFRGIAYGDQGIWMTREAYQWADGFRSVPLMEDLLICRKLARKSKPVLLPGPVMIPDRHWRRGVVRTTIRNWTAVTMFRLGMKPERIAKFYCQRTT